MAAAATVAAVSSSVAAGPRDREDMILETMYRKYRDTALYAELVDVLRGAVSLRIIEYFVAHYSETFGVTYVHKGRLVNVHEEYQSEMRVKKSVFDPFARGKKKVDFVPYEGAPPIKTTVGQLNFFAWALAVGAVQYVREHLAEIDNHHKEFEKRKKGMPKTRRRKFGLIADATVTVDRVSVLVSIPRGT